jgi:hypothetical protein
MWMDLTVAGSINKMQVMLGERLDKVAPGRWVVGRGWDEQRFLEKRNPTRFDLDVVSPDNPVIFYHQSGQVALVNSEALKLAGITKETVAPSGGVIDWDNETGEPTGVLRDSATDLVWRLIPEMGLEELAEAAMLACEKIVQAGITGIHWLAERAMDVAVMKRLKEASRLPINIYMSIPMSLLGEEDLLEGLSEGRARIGCVEIGADGYLASRTAALSKPYLGDPMNRGKLLLQEKAIADQVKNATNKGFQVMVHAMGDKAVDIALAAIESSEGKGRHRIDPAALLNEDLIARIKKQRVVVSVQPLVAASEFSVYDAEEHLGEERARWLYPLKTLLTQGIRVCGGSDCPMERLSPLLGVQSAVTRRFFPQEQLSVDEALQMYSVNAAYASCDEKERGTIEEGKFADLTVLSKDPHDVPASEIQDIRVEMTIINGKVAYSSSD